MMKVTLYTWDGGSVVGTVTLPAMRSYPLFVRLGPRLFKRVGPSVGQECDRYEEVNLEIVPEVKLDPVT